MINQTYYKSKFSFSGQRFGVFRIAAWLHSWGTGKKGSKQKQQTRIKATRCETLRTVTTDNYKNTNF